MNLIDALKENGKARRKSWMNDKYHVIVNQERKAFQAKDSSAPYWIDMSFDNFMATDWEPYKEPCKHEPKEVEIVTFKTLGANTVSVYELNRVLSEERNPICKHCGVKIKAKEWVEA